MEHAVLHPWLRTGVRVAYLPRTRTPLIDRTATALSEAFAVLGHSMQSEPDERTDAVITTAVYGEHVPWREAALFNVRRIWKLPHSPVVYTLLHINTADFRAALIQLRRALARDLLDPADFEFAGLSPSAYHVLTEQGTRGGPILALQRLIQAQCKCLRVLLAVGDDTPELIYHFDLPGAYPVSQGETLAEVARDAVLRLVTTVSTHDISDHRMAGDPVPRTVWQALSTPQAMLRAGVELGGRGFFTEMIRVADLVAVPAVGDSIAAHYSEGCYATYEPELEGLIATVTGRARPMTKDSITEDDLAVITGVRDDWLGAITREVEGSYNLPASSEAVEMAAIDAVLPRIAWDGREVPVVRSKLHGHRGIGAYDPEVCEYVPLAEAYHHYLVSCGSEAQALGIQQALGTSQALNNPDDPRRLVFTILPGHGVFIVEKWAAGKAPFQLIWEAMDSGALEVISRMPQGAVRYIPEGGCLVLDRACLMDPAEDDAAATSGSQARL
ncbi:MAG: hypothetical protein GXY52_11155 [Chloroflexi bacterium]|nr:hypothetical protein [Chloroflexota bacterium]